MRKILIGAASIFICLWCGSPSRQKSDESDTLLTDAARHVRQLFGGRL